MSNDGLDRYTSDASDLIGRFEAVSPAQLYNPVADLLPLPRSRLVDIGAGTGRDAAWLAGMGHEVVAVEPVRELREAAMILHGGKGIEWLDDRLPLLAALRNRRQRFDRVLLSAVWHHLDREDHLVAMRTLADLTLPGGLVIMSLRHDPGHPTRPASSTNVEDTIGAAQKTGFILIRQQPAESAQILNRRAGVHWTWLALALS
jgi:2-polyprenyl-3-methyl-5-hydroxy-6-metoxy-1,4-benzoquinol methylase